MKKRETNAFSSWNLFSYLSEKDVEDAVLDAVSGKLTLPHRRSILPIASPIDLCRIIAAKQFSKALEGAYRANQNMPSELVDKIVGSFFRDFDLEGYYYKEGGPEIVHKAIEGLMKKNDLKIGIVKGFNNRDKWAITPGDIPFELSKWPVLPENPMWDDKIVKIIYSHKFRYRGDTFSPPQLAKVLKEKLNVERDIPKSEIVLVVNRLMRNNMLYLETRPFSSWHRDFSIHITKSIKKDLKKTLKNAP